MASTPPTYDEVRLKGGIALPTFNIHTLLWRLFGPLEESIEVYEDPYGEPMVPPVPYFRKDPPRWHPISQRSLTNPPISSIAVIIDPLYVWQANWREEHRHSFPGMERSLYEPIEGVDNPEEWLLVRCCYKDYPPDYTPIIVQASSEPYVTVHDYVTTIHTWMMSNRNNIIEAMNVLDMNPFVDTTTKLAVHAAGRQNIVIVMESDWMATLQRTQRNELLKRQKKENA